MRIHLRIIQHLADDKTLFLAHAAVQNISLAIEDLSSILQEMIPNYPEMVLNMYDPEHEDATTPIIRAVKKPFNIVYCVPPKSSTTSWQMGMQVLKELANGIRKKPEDFVPHDLYNQFCYSPRSFHQNQHPVLGNLNDFSKILIGRNPFDRLYSAWSDKSRTFRYENGSIDFDAAAVETTWLWGERRDHLTNFRGL